MLIILWTVFFRIVAVYTQNLISLFNFAVFFGYGRRTHGASLFSQSEFEANASELFRFYHNFVVLPVSIHLFQRNHIYLLWFCLWTENVYKYSLWCLGLWNGVDNMNVANLRGRKTQVDAVAPINPGFTLVSYGNQSLSATKLDRNWPLSQS